jgi:hypothetical protein
VLHTKQQEEEEEEEESRKLKFRCISLQMLQVDPINGQFNPFHIFMPYVRNININGALRLGLPCDLSP